MKTITLNFRAVFFVALSSESETPLTSETFVDVH